MSIRERYHTARGLQGLVATERESDVSRSLRRRLWLWRRGFVTHSDAVYDLDEETYRDYLSDYQRYMRTKTINGTWSVALSNKLLFHRVLQPFVDRRMTVYGMIRDGTFHPVDGSSTASTSPLADGGTTVSPPTDSARETSAGTDNAAQRVIDRLEAEGRLVLKWTHGGGGHNVLLCARDGDGYRVNGDHYAESGFRSLVADLEEYLVCEYVEQGPFPARLYPATPNTLRIITMYDDAANEPFVAAAIQRIGTGELGAGAKPPAGGDDVEWHSVHPDIDERIEGERVPGWNRIRSGVLEMAESCSFAPYIGWDVIVTDDDGAFSVIEANSYPSLKSIQVHGPLLADDRVRQFYERNGVC